MNEREANKAAFCSAVFAGFAYVGYTLFKQQVVTNKNAGKRKERGFMLRRLSQTTQTDTGERSRGGGDGKTLVFTSSSVQDRIRQLNLQARQFAETMLAIQTQEPRRPHGAHHRSSQCTPWSTPRTLSPVSFRLLSTSHSSDQLAAAASSSPHSSRFMTAPRRRRRLTDASDAPPPADITAEDRRLLETMLQADNRELNSQEAALLVKMLRSSSVDFVKKTLVTISNCCAFTKNQETLREEGLVPLLTAHLLHPCPSVQMAASQAASNMALNDTNQTLMQDCVEVLLSLLDSDDDDVREAVLSCLVNISVLDRWHPLFTPYLSLLYATIDDSPARLQIQALRLLVNLSCNDATVPCLLAAQGPLRLLHLLEADTDAAVLLRVLTLMANLGSAVQRLHIDPTTDLPPDHKVAAPDTMYARLFGVSCRGRIRDKCSRLANQHPSDDVQQQAIRLKQCLSRH